MRKPSQKAKHVASRRWSDLKHFQVAKKRASENRTRPESANTKIISTLAVLIDIYQNEATMKDDDKKSGRKPSQSSKHVENDLTHFQTALRRASKNKSRSPEVNAEVLRLLSELIRVYQEEELENIRRLAGRSGPQKVA